MPGYVSRVVLGSDPVGAETDPAELTPRGSMFRAGKDRGMMSAVRRMTHRLPSVRCMVQLASFPILFASRPRATADFYERLGFACRLEHPSVSEPTYIAMRRGHAEIAIVDATWPTDHYNGTWSAGMRFEMFVYVDDVDETVQALIAAGYTMLKPPANLPWGDRFAYVADPDGNPVAVSSGTIIERHDLTS